MKRLGLAILSVALITVAAFAHGNEKHVMGKVTKIGNSSISVQLADGSVKTVNVVGTTKFLKAGAAATQQDLKVGDRVVIHAKPNGDALEATEVKFGSTASAEKH